MKKILSNRRIFFWIIFPIFTQFVVSCSSDDEVFVDNSSSANQFDRKIDSVKIFGKKEIGDTTKFIVYFSKQMDCEQFKNYDIERMNVYNLKVKLHLNHANNNCNVLQNQQTGSNLLYFVPDVPGTYNFKFWSGKNASGEDTYFEKNIEVTD